MRVKSQPKVYLVGCSFYFISMVLLIVSMLPALWVCDKEDRESDVIVGRSVWEVNLRTCLNRHVNFTDWWNCAALQNYGRDERTLAATLLIAAVVSQVGSSLVLLLYNVFNVPYDCHNLPENITALSLVLDLTGMLIYVRFTHNAVNIAYGPGFVLNVCSIPFSYIGLCLTGLYNTQIITSPPVHIG